MDEKRVTAITTELKRIREEAKLNPFIWIDWDEKKPWINAQLYLLATLVEDITEIQQLAFVGSRDGQKTDFLGFATPRAIRRILAIIHENNLVIVDLLKLMIRVAEEASNAKRPVKAKN